MRYRQFGKTGWRVSEIGFGGARIGGLLAQDGGRATSLKTLEAACDAGINFFDTADMYSQGESEILVGRAFRSNVDQHIKRNLVIFVTAHLVTPAGTLVNEEEEEGLLPPALPEVPAYKK